MIRHKTLQLIGREYCVDDNSPFYMCAGELGMPVEVDSLNSRPVKAGIRQVGSLEVSTAH